MFELFVGFVVLQEIETNILLLYACRSTGTRHKTRPITINKNRSLISTPSAHGSRRLLFSPPGITTKIILKLHVS